MTAGDVDIVTDFLDAGEMRRDTVKRPAGEKAFATEICNAGE
jgi:hypothetical protein